MTELRTVKERLKEFISQKKLSNKEFEAKAGLGNGFVSGGKGEFIREESLKKISEVFPDLNVEWLKHGVGSMLNGNTPINSNNIENNSNSSFFATNLGNNNNVQKNIGIQPSVVEETLRSLTRVIEKQASQIDDILSIIKTLK